MCVSEKSGKKDKSPSEAKRQKLKVSKVKETTEDKSSEQISHVTDEHIFEFVHNEATPPPPDCTFDSVITMQSHQSKQNLQQLVSSQSNDTETVICKDEGTGSSGKRRRGSRWDQLPEKCKDGESVEEDDRSSSKRRKTRWDTAENQMKLLGPLHLPDFTKEPVPESDSHTEIQDLTKELVDINKLQKDQSPSSELIKRRQRVISELIKKQPTFRTPPKYRPYSKHLKKIYVPVKQYPSYNFVGLILGPRGNTIKRMERETGARILLRGLGSSVRGTSHAYDNDDLHVRIEADDEGSLEMAVKTVEKLLTPVDDRSNEHKQKQLKELASLRNSCKEENTCYLCGEQGHPEHDCPNKPFIFTSGETCDNEGNDVDRDEALLQNADIFVDQLPKKIEERHFREFFCPFGNLLDAKVVRYEKKKGKSRCCGYVKFENPSDAADIALRLKGFKYRRMWICRVAGRLTFESMGPTETRPQLSSFASNVGPAETRVTQIPLDLGESGLFISNLPESVNNSRLKELFCPFGKIVDSRVDRGSGVVKFEDPEDAALALSLLNGFELEGKILAVRANPTQTHQTRPEPIFTPFGANTMGQSPYSSSSSGYVARFPGDPDYVGSQMFNFGAPEVGPSPPSHVAYTPGGNIRPIYWPSSGHPP